MLKRWLAVLFPALIAAGPTTSTTQPTTRPGPPPRNAVRPTPLPFMLGVSLSGTVMRLTRAQMLEVLRQDYVRTAAAKGLRERTVVLSHAMKNALIPVVTVIGLQVPVLVGGSVIVESIYRVPGIGQWFFTAIQARDYTAVQAIALLTAVAVVVSNLVVDLAYAYLDPRIRYS